jgi:hypothetical protein
MQDSFFCVCVFGITLYGSELSHGEFDFFVSGNLFMGSDFTSILIHPGFSTKAGDP